MSIFSKIKERIDAEVNLRIETEIANKRQEVSARLLKVEAELRDKSELELAQAAQELKIKLAEVNLLADTYDIQINALKKLQCKAEDEQKKLWDKLDILRDSFTADQIWSKLWGLAYSKAIDVAWPLLEKEIPHLVGLAEARAYLKAKKEADEDYKIQIDNLIKASGEEIPRIKILALKKEIHEKMLVANRSKNIEFENKYLGQLALIDLLIGE